MDLCPGQATSGKRGMQMQRELKQKCSVKCSAKLFPLCKPPSKHSTRELCHTSESFFKQLNLGDAPTQAIQKECMKDTTLSFSPLASALQDESLLPGDPKIINGDTEEFIRVANTQPTVIADVIKQRCPSVFTALKLAIKDEIAAAYQMLCRRSNGSVLYSNRNSFKSLRDFDFDRVWTEMKSNGLFL